MNEIVSAMIVCVDQKYGIGLQGKLPWKSSADMDFFKKMTHDSVCIMGRNTYEGILLYRKNKSGALLENRASIVVSKQLTESNVYCPIENIKCVPTIEHASFLAIDLVTSQEYKRIFYIGGVQIFKSCIPFVDRIYLNMILEDYGCDTFFPDEILSDFKMKSHGQLANNLLTFKYKKENK